MVKFLSYNTRKQIFTNKKQLKSTGTSMTKKRLVKRKWMLKEARVKHYFTNECATDFLQTREQQ